MRILVLTDRKSGEAAMMPLLLALRATRAAEVEAIAVERLRRPAPGTVIIAASGEALSSANATMLTEFVREGGGLLLLGGAVLRWREHPAIGELLGGLPAMQTPATEIIAHPAADHEVTRRLDPDIILHDRVLLYEQVPDDATPLLTVNWRYTRTTLAYLRPCGAGMVGFLGLTGAGEAPFSPASAQFAARLARYLGGWREGGPVGMGMLGYGAIGFEHATAIAATPGLEMRLVCDRSAARLEAAQSSFPTARLTTEARELAADPTVDAIIIGTPPNTHAALAREMLEAGKHVIVEKPFCMTTAEADSLIATARERDLALTVYQNRRWDPDFLAISEVVRAGTIGDVFHLETFIGGFAHPCDYWHSHAPISGGVFYDWGSHYLDWMLQLFPDAVRDVRATAHKRVWQDVTNADQANLIIHFADGAEAQFMHSDVAALLKPKWYLMGTKGAIVGHWRTETVKARNWNGDLIETPLAPSEAPPEITVALRARAGQIHQQRLALPPAPRHPFHRNFADHLLTGEPLAVPPESARRNIAVMEAAAYSAAHGSEVVPLM